MPAPDSASDQRVHVAVRPLANGRYEGLPEEPTEVDHSAPVVDPSRMDPEQLRAHEQSIVDDIWGQDQQTRKQVGVVDVPRLSVRQYDLANGEWVQRVHGDQPHEVWNGERWVSSVTFEHECTSGEPVRGPFNFPVGKLDGHDFEVIEEKSSRKVTNSAGMTVRRERNTNKYNAMAIYLATPVRYRSKPGMWDDRAMWDKYGVGNGTELIMELLLPGEAVQALAVIMHLSRFSPQTEEILGNLSGMPGVS